MGFYSVGCGAKTTSQPERVSATILIRNGRIRQGTQMGSQEIRSFVGGLRPGDRGIYVSTGGFSKEAKYEAERSNIPLTLIELDDLATLVEQHYENFDANGRALIPLTKNLLAKRMSGTATTGIAIL